MPRGISYHKPMNYSVQFPPTQPLEDNRLSLPFRIPVFTGACSGTSYSYHESTTENMPLTPAPTRGRPPGPKTVEKRRGVSALRSVALS